MLGHAAARITGPRGIGLNACAPGTKCSVSLGVMKLPDPSPRALPPAASFQACLGAVLELDPEHLPAMAADGDPLSLGVVSRWLGGLGLGIARIAEPAAFTWPGPWLARIRPPALSEARFVVMFGVPSGVVWDPAGDGILDNSWIEDGYVLAAADIALARPPRPAAPGTTGRVEQIWVSRSAGEPARDLARAQALADRGLDGDRHVVGAGTFGSGLPGSALTLIEAEVCESFHPPLGPDDHRRNLVTRGVALNGLVGHEFMIGAVRCRGMRLCEPCTVVQRYAGRPVLRELVHRGGLRADILGDGEIRVGDDVRAVGAETAA
jgi:hypothetical protein